ncbi:hypothetical protein VCRA2122O12_270033 [Vibrio crassostreae]|nr:hypothetical protein VCRA2110O1_270045 [Vibrio crassostreae]CAK1941362.1 hypothetical protein VCRA2110O4_270045 [Vibrio crassostreae]CAK1946832.1 hypothetical protein VCRA2114E5_260045 [Vibrio crassostreae]CAK2793696.1 hypothetical protein VCRA2122O10_260045 [Vibrio crassostreae]CAK3350138.1 hypothetical protein VCRA2122O11_240045 [Vibrio crassostreae]
MVARKTSSMVMGYKTAVTGYEYRDAKSLKQMQDSIQRNSKN